MDIINFTSWLKEGRLVDIVDMNTALVSIGIKDPRRDDAYLMCAMTVESLANQIGGTVTSVGLIAGTGISVSGSPITSSGSITVTNSAPDQVVAITAGTGIGVTGTYPNFTVTNSAPSSGGTVTSVNTTGLISGGPITSSGTITTSMSSNKLVGRSTSGVAIM